MLDLSEFKKPLVTFQYGGPPHYIRRYPARLNQTFPMPTLNMPPAMPRFPPQNVKQYPHDMFGNRLYYIPARAAYKINLF